MYTPSTVSQGFIGLPPASSTVGNGATAYLTLSCTSPRNHGPENTIGALPSLNRLAINVDDGSAGRMPSCLYHFSIVFTAATFCGESITGVGPGAKTCPPCAFISAAWKKKLLYS